MDPKRMGMAVALLVFLVALSAGLGFDVTITKSGYLNPVMAQGELNYALQVNDIEAEETSSVTNLEPYNAQMEEEFNGYSSPLKSHPFTGGTPSPFPLGNGGPSAYNISIEKVDAHDPVQNGTLLNYTIRVNNTGTNALTNITIIETYDTNVTFVSADPVPSSGNNTWTFSIINASESKLITVTVNVSSSLNISDTLINFVNLTCDQNVSANTTEYTTIDIPSTLNLEYQWGLPLPDTRGGIYADDTYIWIADHKNGLWRSYKCNDSSSGDITVADSALWDIYHSGAYIYGASTDEALYIYNDSDGSVVGSTGLGGGIAYGVYTSGNFSYVATTNGLRVVNISNPASPSLITTLNTSLDFIGVKGKGDYVFASDFTNDELHIYDLSNPSSPIHVATEDFATQGWSGDIRRLFVAADDYVYVVNDQGDLYIVNVSDPSSPDDVGSIKLPGGNSNMPGGGVFVRGDDAFFCTAVGNDQGYLYWVDVSNRSNPVFIDSLYDAEFGFNEPYVEGCYLLVAAHDGYKVYYATGWQPDGWISNTNESNYIGNHIYNDNGTDQTKEQVIPRGDTAIYSIKVQNDAPEPQAILVQGDAAIEGWTFTYYDSAMSNITDQIIAGTYSTELLDPLQSLTITLLMASDTNPGNDTANSSITLTGTACNGNDCVPLNVDVVVAQAQNHGLDITKKANTSGPVSIGEIIEYILNVSNNGDVTITNIVVHDSLTGDHPVGVLNTSENKTVYTNYTVTHDDVCRGWINNTANATGNAADDNITTPAVYWDILTSYNASLNITKVANQTVNLAVGDVIEYTINVTNTGDVNLTNVLVHDSRTGDHIVGALNVSETKTLSPKPTHTVNQTDACRGWLNNSANASATDYCGINRSSNLVSVNATTTYNASLNITKVANTSGIVSPGDNVSYNITVCNTGNLTLNNVSLNDSLLGTFDLDTILPGSCEVVNATYNVTINDCNGFLNNTANAIGVDACNNIITTGYVNVSIPVKCITCLSGYKLDTNGTGLSGWTINVTNSTGYVRNAQTNATGYWELCGLMPDDYNVTEVLPERWKQLAPTQGKYNFTLQAGENKTGLNFTNCKCNGSISDFVWNDANKNGIQDANESGIAGVEVNLYRHQSPGELLDSTFTDQNGFYLFTNICEGFYSLGFVPPPGFVFTAQNQGGDHTLDSNADPGTGQTEVFYLVLGEHNPTFDVGLYQQPYTVPALRPVGMLALVSLLAISMGMSICVRKRK